MTMTIRNADLDDFKLFLKWAALEGWNPGIGDADAFFAADPTGFFLREVNGEPVCAVSVVNHDSHFAFLGFYICRPEFRGQGHGIAVWSAAVAHAAGRSIGLDGVADQVANYTRSGFVRWGSTVRHRGAHKRCGRDQTRAVLAEDVRALVMADERATGVGRGRFSEAWFSDTRVRHTRVLALGEDATTAFATYRRCQEGVKIAPLFAESVEQVEVLLGSVPVEFGDGPVFLDVPDSCSMLIDFLQSKGFGVTFRAARMYRGIPPAGRPPPAYAVTGMEVG